MVQIYTNYHTPDMRAALRFSEITRSLFKRRIERMNAPKISLDEVIAYAKNQIRIYVGHFAAHLPDEQKEEIEQEANFRLIKAYPGLDEARGWKSFVQLHCKGAVLDYLRDGQGFKETSWIEEDENTALDRPRLRIRLSSPSNEDDDFADVEMIAGQNGIYADENEITIFNPNWNLVARMARVDDKVHLIAKRLMGWSQEDLCVHFRISRERLSQRIREWWDEMDSPDKVGNLWTEQQIYAFGLSAYFNMEPKDNGFGWDSEPIDLCVEDSPLNIALIHQESFGFH